SRSGERSTMERSSGAARAASELGIAEAVHRMVVDHTRSLHERVADCRSHEAEAALFQLAAHGVRYRRACRSFAHRAPAVDARAPSGELPDVLGKAAELLLHHEEGARIRDS